MRYTQHMDDANVLAQRSENKQVRKGKAISYWMADRTYQKLEDWRWRNRMSRTEAMEWLLNAILDQKPKVER